MEKYTDKQLEKMRDAYNTPDNKSKSVPIENIRLDWHEGRHDNVNYEKTDYKSWDSYQKALKEIWEDEKDYRYKDGKDQFPGTYTKTKATVTWKDGTQRTDRIDLSDSEGDYNPDKEYIGDYWKRRNLQNGKMTDKGWEPTKGSFVKSRTGRELSTGNDDEQTKEKDSLVKISKFKKEEPRAFNTAVDMQVEADLERMNPSYHTDGQRKKLIKYYEKNPQDIDEKWYMATFSVYKFKDFSKYMKKDAYTKGADKGRRGSSAPFGNGKGKGWHGEMIRHRNAALKGRGMRK